MFLVAPLAGAWIEIYILLLYSLADWASLPSRERGLKLQYKILHRISHGVAPLAGAWIEIAKDLISLFAVMTSLPSRERGLKYQ